MAERASIEPALERLSEVLPIRAPEVWSSLRPSVTDADLEILRQAVAPYALPNEIVALLRWADGQAPDAPWWPALESGRLLTAAEAAAHYAWLRDGTDQEGSLYSLLVPIVHDGWYQVGIELVSDGPGAVIDYGFGDQPSVLAPTLAVMLDVTGDMIEAGICSPQETQDARVWRARRAALIDDRPEWSSWPYDHTINLAGANWPPHWRSALQD